MSTFERVAVAIVNMVIFGLAVRTGFQAQKEATPAHKAAYQ